MLDLGCGAGRHVVYLAKQGFEVFGMDISENGLEHTRQWLAGEGLTAQLVKSDMAHVRYADGFFDAVLCFYVIYHQTLAGMRGTIAEIYRVLRPGGFALISLQSKRGYRYRCGEEIEPDTFISNVGADAGMLHHYSDLTEIASLFERFVVHKVELEESLHDGNRHSHWQVLIERE